MGKSQERRRLAQAACAYRWTTADFPACPTGCGQHETQQQRSVVCNGPVGDITITGATAANPVELTISPATITTGDTVWKGLLFGTCSFLKTIICKARLWTLVRNAKENGVSAGGSV